MRKLMPTMTPTVLTDGLSLDDDGNLFRKNSGTILFEPATDTGTMDVRRPLSGIAIKPNTHAFVSIVRSDGSKVKVFNDLGSLSRPVRTGTGKGEKFGRRMDPLSGTPSSPFWTDWFLQSVQESRQEKFQIVETFGEPILYVFGERPRLLQFTGYLSNTADFNWRAQFWENWELYFRATKLVEGNHRMYIGFDDILVSGYPLNAQARQLATDPNRIMFSFAFLMTSYTNFAMNAGGSEQANAMGSVSQLALSATTTRIGEFVTSGTFADPTYELARNVDGPLSKIVGGDRLLALQGVQELRDSLTGLGISFFDVLNSPELRYIKDTRTAVEVLMAHSRSMANQAAYKGVTDMAEDTSGGIGALNFWFGLVAQIYQVVFINGLNMLSSARETQPNRFMDLIDYTMTLGNPYAVAQTMGYTATSVLGNVLDDITGKHAGSNMVFDGNRGLVAKGQDSSYGEILSYRNKPSYAQGQDGASNVPSAPFASTQPVSFVLSQAAGYDAPQGESGSATAADARGVTDLLPERTAERELVEREALERQEDQREVNHGAMNVVEDPTEVDDDGSFPLR
jgi:hypothetical protein